MAFVSVETANYRNIRGGELATGASFVFLVGENGQGKSNFLDALYTLCYGASFRGSGDQEVARIGERSWRIAGRWQAQAGQPVQDDVSISWQKNSKRILDNGKEVRDRKQLVEKYPAVVFCHDDLDFVQGEPERRRFFFDQTAGLVKTSYIDALRSYRQVLKLRNAYLKEISGGRARKDLLDVYDQQMATHGLYLQQERDALVRDFNKTFSDCHERISCLGSPVAIEYRPSWQHSDVSAVCAALVEHRGRDEILGTSASGPHRDRFMFLYEHGDFSVRASTGQRRLLSLVLRIAQAEFYTQRSGRRPVLLLDDVLLELDPEKRKRFMKNLPGAEQCFFTFLPGEPYRDYINEDTLVYWTEDGQFRRT